MRQALALAVVLATLMQQPAGAAPGDPELLGYLSEVQERIQDAADHRRWLTGDRQGGLVYVAFVLAPAGGIVRATAMPERSSGTPELQELAKRIVESAAPFPPFPPSLQAPQRTIYVPLAFLADGS